MAGPTKGQEAAAATGDDLRKLLASMTAGDLQRMQRTATAEERKARYEKERAERLKKLTVVRFLRAYRVYNRDEVAGLEPTEANIAIAEGFAVRVAGAAPANPVAPVDEGAKEQQRAKLVQLRRYISAMDEDDASQFTPEGLPRTERLAQLMGMAVSDEERNEAWKLFQGDVVDA